MSPQANEAYAPISEKIKDMTVWRLMDMMGASLEMGLLSGEQGLTRVIVSWELSRPGLAFAGFLQQFYSDRIQILGGNEVAYLDSLPKRQRVKAIRSVLDTQPPCLVLTTDFAPPDGLVEACDATDTPLLRTPIRTSLLCSKLTSGLMTEFAPSITAHGSLVNVFGLGVLISGQSGVGKSECSLELISRGHRLVADDIVIIRRIGPNVLLGRSSEVLRYHMEVHGIGIVNVQATYGVGAVIDETEIDVHIQLEEKKEGKSYEQLGLEDRFTRILGVLAPEYVLPVESGRNLAIIIEAAVLSQKMKNMGVNVAAQFNARLIHRMSRATVPPPADEAPKKSATRPKKSTKKTAKKNRR